MWYKADYQPLRFAVRVSASGIGGVVGTALLWAIGHNKGALSPWKHQSIIVGAVTSAWKILIAFTLPRSPQSARFLSGRDRTLALERIRTGRTGIENTKFKSYQFKEAFIDQRLGLSSWLSLAIKW